MPSLRILVQTKDQGSRQESAVAFGQPPIPLRFDGVTIMEAGTVEGKASLLFKLVDETGKEYYGELTAALLHMVDAATRGAEIRFETEKTNKS